MMKRGVAEILAAISKLKTKQERIDALGTWNDNEVLKKILQLTFDQRAKWLLPEGMPPYKPNNGLDLQNILYSEARKLYLFILGGSPNLKQAKREMLFIEMIENLAPEDADMMCSVKDKKLPWKQITPDIVEAAFPGLIGPTETSQEIDEQVI